MSRHRRTLTLWLLLLAAPALLPAVELLELPEIPVESLPEPARERLVALRVELEAAAAAEPSDRPALADAYGELGGFFFLYDFLDAAEAAWTNASSLEPEAFDWHYLLGAMLRLKGDFDAAASRLERAVAIRPEDVPTRIRLGRIRTDQRDLAAAADHFARALELRPESAAARYGLGRIAILEGRWAEAIEQLESALPGQPEGTTVHHQLGLAYRGLGELESARHHLERNRGVQVAFSDPLVESLAGLAEGSRARARAGIQAQKSGRLDVAARLLREAARLDPEDAWIRYNLGVVLRERGETEAALEEFRQAVRHDPEYRNAQYNLGQLLAELGDLDGAVRHFERAREIDPEDRVAWLDLAVALSRRGDAERSLAELQELVRRSPDFVEAKLSLATLLAQLDRQGEALGRVEEILAGDASTEELGAAHLLRARLIEGSDPAAAVEHYRRAVELDEESREARFALAMAFGRQGRFGEASRQFAALVALAPGDPELRMGQTMALLLGESYAEALAALQAAVERFPEDLAITHSLARLLATCPDAGVRDGRRALELARRVLEAGGSPDHAETVGMALAELGRYDEAVQLQGSVVERLEALGAPGEMLRTSRRYLALYESGRPVRAPWRPGE